MQSSPTGVFNPAQSAVTERRGCTRHKIHSPAHVSLNRATPNSQVELNPILDLGESGFSFRTAIARTPGETIDLRLNFEETNSSIPARGEVVWSGPSGRTGVRLRPLQGSARRQLQEFLFVNLMLAAARHAALEAKAADLEIKAEEYRAYIGAAQAEKMEVPSGEDYAEVLQKIGALQQEVISLKNDPDQALGLLANEARGFTRASGAAIAITNGQAMICRASSGSDAPGVGARFQAGSGFSGECVRSARLLYCEDSETDSIADRDSCRALGIRSMLAMPVRAGDAVVGLVEIFAREPAAFGPREKIFLRRLEAVVLSAVCGLAEPKAPAAAATSTPEALPLQPAEATKESSVDGTLPQGPVESAPAPAASAPRPRGVLVGLIVAALLLAGATLWLQMRKGAAAFPAQKAVAAEPKPAPVSKPSAQVVPGETELHRLTRLADQGDATAEFALGARYALGEEVKQDYAAAARWFALAADQGHVTAQATLGAYYWSGRGVPQDLYKAYFWSVLALAGGDQASKYRVSALASTLDREQIIAAQEQADEWLRQHQAESKNSSKP